MDHDAYLPFFLLAVPLLLAIIDRLAFRGGTTAGVALGYPASMERPSVAVVPDAR